MRVSRATGAAAGAVVLLLNCLCLAQAQSSDNSRPQIGAVDAQPILQPTPKKAGAVRDFWRRHGKMPETAADQVEINHLMAERQCEDLKAQIAESVREIQSRRLAVAVFPEEIASLAKSYWDLHDPAIEYQKLRQLSAAETLAASEVIDRGLDQKLVYKDLIAPQGVSEEIWLTNLAMWRTPEGRAAQARSAAAAAALTIDDMKKSVGVSLEKMMRSKGLDDAVDLELAIGDPQFRNFLDELRTKTQQITPFKSQTAWIATDHVNYLEAKRQEWWVARRAEMQVTLSDPTLADRCKLGSVFGVKAPGNDKR